MSINNLDHCLTFISIYHDYWKSLIKIQIKNPLEIANHMLVWIYWFRKYEHAKSIKSYNLDQTTLFELYNKSHEGLMLSKCQENTFIGLNIYFELSNYISLTKVEILFWSKIWSLTQNKSYRYFGVEQMLFMDQVMIQPLSASNSGYNIEEKLIPEFKLFSKSEIHPNRNDVLLSPNCVK